MTYLLRNIDEPLQKLKNALATESDRTRARWLRSLILSLEAAVYELREDRTPQDEYTYRFNGRDGTFDLIEIIHPDGREIATLYYWDEPDSDEAARVEEAAKLICHHLNHWHIGELDETSSSAEGEGRSA